MQKIAAVIYDMDGVLIDSEPLWQEAEKEVFATVGLNLSTSDCLQTKGMRIDEVVNYWYSRHPWSGMSQSKIVASILDRLIALIHSKGNPLPGVIHSIEYFKSRKIPMAIATSSPVRVMTAVLEKLELRNKFDVLCSAENEAHGKPHPAVYLTTAKQLSVSPKNCLVIEDSISGMHAALAANMNVIVIPEKNERHLSVWQQADHHLTSLVDIPDLQLF